VIAILSTSLDKKADATLKAVVTRESG